MTERQTLFADVLLPVPMRQVFTYRVPFDFNGQIRSGLRVLVPFGKNKILTGLVTNVHQNVPQTYQAKYIDTILDDSPIITGKQLAFWDWLSSYYMAPIGDVMNAALPANFKLASESKFCLHPDAPIPRPELSTRAAEIIELLEVQSQMSSKEIAERLGIKTIQPYLKKLLELKLIAGAEEVQERYTPKTQLFLFLQQEFQEEEQLSAFLNTLERKPRTEKQVQALLRFIQLATEAGSLAAPVSKTLLLKHDVSSSAIATLEKQGVFQIERLQVDRHARMGEGKGAFKPLTAVQQVALNDIEKGFEQKEVCLFYGVTG